MTQGMFLPNLKEISAVAASLPAAPQVLADLNELLEDVDSDISDVVRLLRRDATLAASVLRVGNSAHYGLGAVSSIESAVNRVGFGEVHRLAGCAAVSLLADRDLHFYNIDGEIMREHMICTALACEYLAENSGFKPRNAYTLGLLRTMGMLVLDRMARRLKSAPEVFDIEKDHTYGAWEERVLQIRSEAVTAVVLCDWGFSSEVIEAVREAGHPAAPGPVSQGTAMLNVAGWVVNQIGFGLPGERDLRELSPADLEVAWIDKARLDTAVEQVQTHFEEVRGILA
jgi:HD-like signal output (HDOD) protein